jgi:hypothetical protein
MIQDFQDFQDFLLPPTSSDFQAPELSFTRLQSLAFYPKIVISARCSPLLSESGFTGFKDLQDFFPPHSQ